MRLIQAGRVVIQRAGELRFPSLFCAGTFAIGGGSLGRREV